MTKQMHVSRWWLAGILTAAVVLGGPTVWGAEDKPAATAAAPIGAPEVAAADGGIARAVATLLQRQHYSAHPLDDDVSTLLYEEFFDHLDPNHDYFTEADREAFAPYRRILDDMLVQGNIEFAVEVYKRFVQRVEERVAFVRQRVEQPFDFAADDTLELDREKRGWLADAKAQDARWEKIVKYRLLIYMLTDEERLRAATTPKPDAPKPEVAKPDDKAPEAVEVEKKDAEFRSKYTPKQRVIRQFEQFLSALKDNDHSDLLELYLGALTRVYDPHSSYMSARSVEDFDISMRLSLQGIGATLSSEDGITKVVSLVPGGPAKTDGRLQPGDRIIAVGQGDEEPEDVVNVPLNKVVRKIRGPKGTAVRLTIVKSLNGAPSTIRLVRDEVKLTESEAKAKVKVLALPDGRTLKLGWVDLPSFYADFDAQRANDPNAKSTTRDVTRLVDKMLKEDHIDGLLVDLRGNGGGSLDEAINLSGLFIPEGPVVQVKYPGGQEVRRDEDNGFAYDLPLVVMTDRASASASEIFAAAIQDYERGVIVGDVGTHGKGTVQTILKLDRFPNLRAFKPGALKYTMAKFYRVNGGSTQLRGVTTDVGFPSYYDFLEVGEGANKHALGWDEIKALDVTKSKLAVGHYVPQLKERSLARLGNDAAYKDLVADITRYGERQRERLADLSLEKLRAKRQEDEQWAKRSAAMFKGLDSMAPKDEAPETAPAKVSELRDPILRESLSILGDLVELLRKDGLAAQEPPKAKAVQ